MAKVSLVTPPSPRFADIDRQAAGGMGLWKPSERSTVGHSEYAQYDLAMLWTAGVLLERGDEVSWVDGQAERLDEVGLATRVADTQPDVIVGMVQLVSLESDLSLLTSAKQRCPGARLIIVGSVAKLSTNEIFAHEAVDYVVVSEPEYATSDLLAALDAGQEPTLVAGLALRSNGKVELTAARKQTELSTLPITPYHLLAPYPYVDEFYFNPEKVGLVATTRGCPYKCAYYCPYPLAYGKKVRQRSAEMVVEEMVFLNKEYGVRSFYFRDQVFTISTPHARAICQGIIASGLDISWICETRFDLLASEELLDEMKEAGCEQIHFGLESGDAELFETIGKPGTTLEVAVDTVARIQSRGIKAHCHVIVGLPGESWKTVQNTAAFIHRLGVSRINLNRCIPYPGTDLHEEASREGWIETDDWSRYGGEFTMRTADMSTRELELALKYLSLDSRHRDKRPIRRRDRILRPALNALVGFLGWRSRVMA